MCWTNDFNVTTEMANNLEQLKRSGQLGEFWHNREAVLAAQSARAERPGLWRQVVQHSGELLISLGGKLKGQVATEAARAR